LIKNKKIEKIDLRRKLFKNKKDNNITSNGVIFLKESIIKNKYLKEIYLDYLNKLINRSNTFNNEFHLVYKLLKLTKNKLDL
jgi:hypothetical protein